MNSDSVKLEDVFKTNGIPTHTFVRPSQFERLKIALRTPGRGVVAEGPSGIGKTTCIDQALRALGLGDDCVRLSARRREHQEYIENLPDIEDAGFVIVDDFHKVSDRSKKQLADYMKALADEGNDRTKLVFVGINNAGDALIRFAHDLINRIDIITFEAEPDEKVREVIDLGEAALNIQVNVKDEIVGEARGSFYLAQLLAHELCLTTGITEAQAERVSSQASFETIRAAVFDRLRLLFEERTMRFARGPRMRPEGRAPYLHLLNWLAESAEWSISIDRMLRQHPELKGSVSQIVDKGYIERLIRQDSDIAAVLHFDPIARILTVEDPQFVFYLRNLSWPKFAGDIGFVGIEFPCKYDVALSFAGSDRDVAEALFGKLAERELEVFYDRNEQHRILAEDIEQYLRPIYMSDAQLVVCLLGPDYPKRVWTKIESDAFKSRFKQGAVIPIWFDSAPPGVFDESAKVGGIKFSRQNALEPQVEEIAQLIGQKVREVRLDTNIG